MQAADTLAAARAGTRANDTPRAGRSAPDAVDLAELAAARDAIRAVRPDLGAAEAVVHPAGWDCLAVEMGGALFKFPRTEAAATRLRGEPARLDLARAGLARRHVAMPCVPQMRLHTAPRLFSEHAMLRGAMVDPAAYHAMGPAARERLADDVAAVYVALHEVDTAQAQAAGVGRLPPWPPAAQLFDAAARVLDPPLLARVAATMGRVAVSHPDALVFGHFDTHGWNMAYDAEAGRLTGLFDFGDAGLGARHTDLSYPSFVSPELTARVVRRYEARGGRPVDLPHVLDLHTVLRVIEIVDAGDRPAPFVWALTDWLAALDRLRARGGPWEG
ncbi:phosphotransferase family protein [Acuticoccus sp. I52.16.1]|uniref:phosphotransferase family protein n=1 Tax=Acuticoccus sp. I52.16.1 TaxID=2928472 RepID=UPI001FD585CA|nr:aminoglycoside phosphotransferase family protein [Acuticoccus sp. I52.16.1]UOM36122.1 aminoglycoside phosphotransferase family protein [Acuticoccus sp. I52.16.1]